MKLLKIKAMLVENGIKLNSIAERAGVKRSTVSVVLCGKGKSKNIQKAIADALGVQVSDLWADEKPRRKAA